jgi:hypothetical protein
VFLYLYSTICDASIADNGGIAAWIDDGFCDDINNKKECDYDGGDCCGLSAQMNFCVDCSCKGKQNKDKQN